VPVAAAAKAPALSSFQMIVTTKQRRIRSIFQFDYQKKKNLPDFITTVTCQKNRVYKIGESTRVQKSMEMGAWWLVTKALAA
jgi:hypothetical protein